MITAAVMAALSFCGFAQIANQQGELVIKFENYVGDKKLILDSAEYKNELGQSFTVSKFNYYISHIELGNADGKKYICKEYFLVKEENSESKTISIKVPAGNYTSISYIVGVDSLHNCSGLQTGALDPANGMFWAWNTGYVFLKLEGHASQSKSPGNIFEYHIGGFREPNNCIRTVKLEIGNWKFENGETVSVNVKADAAEVLKTPTTIDFSKLSSVTDFHNAAIIADNYVDMFSLIPNPSPKEKGETRK
jgi:hypothetical protein